MSAPVRVGVLGTGRIGRMHAELLARRVPGLALAAVHDFDMARYVTGSEVEEVYARGEVRIDPALGAEGDFDTVAVTLRHADGTLDAWRADRRLTRPRRVRSAPCRASPSSATSPATVSTAGRSDPAAARRSPR